VSLRFYHNEASVHALSFGSELFGTERSAIRNESSFEEGSAPYSHGGNFTVCMSIVTAGIGIQVSSELVRGGGAGAVRSRYAPRTRSHSVRHCWAHFAASSGAARWPCLDCLGGVVGTHL